MKKIVGKFSTLILIVGFLFSTTSCTLSGFLDGLGKSGTNVFAGSSDSVAAKTAEETKSTIENSSLNNKSDEDVSIMEGLLSEIKGDNEGTEDADSSNISFTTVKEKVDDILDALSISSDDFTNIKAQISKSTSNDTAKEKLKEAIASIEFSENTQAVYKTAAECLSTLVKKAKISDTKIGSGDDAKTVGAYMTEITEGISNNPADILMLAMFTSTLSNFVDAVDDVVGEVKDNTDFQSYVEKGLNDDNRANVLEKSKVATSLLDMLSLSEALGSENTKFGGMLVDLKEQLLGKDSSSSSSSESN